MLAVSHAKRPNKPYVVVVWDDAHGDGSEVTVETLKHEPAVYHSYGWLLKSDDVGVSIVQEWCESDGSFRGPTFIPRKMVRSETHLELRRAATRKSRAASTRTAGGAE